MTQKVSINRSFLPNYGTGAPLTGRMSMVDNTPSAQAMASTMAKKNMGVGDGFDWARALSTEERTKLALRDPSLWNLGIDRNLYDKLYSDQVAAETAAFRQAMAGKAIQQPAATPAPAATSAPTVEEAQAPAEAPSFFSGQKRKDLKYWKPLPTYR